MKNAFGASPASRWTTPRRSAPSATTSRPWRRRATPARGSSTAKNRSIYFGARRVEGLPGLPDLRRGTRTPHQLQRDRSQPARHRRRRTDRRAAVRSAAAHRQGHQDRRAELPCGRREREGLLLRPVPGRVRDHPLGCSGRCCARARNIELLAGSRARPASVQPAMDDATVALRIERC